MQNDERSGSSDEWSDHESLDASFMAGMNGSGWRGPNPVFNMGPMKRDARFKKRLGLAAIVVTLSLGCVAWAAFPSASGTDKSGGPPVSFDGPKQTFAGQVAEKIGTGSYTYMRLAIPGGADRWVVTMGKGEALGTDVSVIGFAEKTDFESKRLGRTFDRLVFGIVRAP